MLLKTKMKILFGKNKMKTLNLNSEQVLMLKTALNIFIDYIGSLETMINENCEKNNLNKSDYINNNLYTDVDLAKKLLQEL